MTLLHACEPGYRFVRWTRLSRYGRDQLTLAAGAALGAFLRTQGAAVRICLIACWERI